MRLSPWWDLIVIVLVDHENVVIVLSWCFQDVCVCVSIFYQLIVFFSALREFFKISCSDLIVNNLNLLFLWPLSLEIRKKLEVLLWVFLDVVFERLLKLLDLSVDLFLWAWDGLSSFNFINLDRTRAVQVKFLNILKVSASSYASIDLQFGRTAITVMFASFHYAWSELGEDVGTLATAEYVRDRSSSLHSSGFIIVWTCGVGVLRERICVARVDEDYWVIDLMQCRIVDAVHHVDSSEISRADFFFAQD